MLLYINSLKTLCLTNVGLVIFPILLARKDYPILVESQETSSVQASQKMVKVCVKVLLGGIVEHV